MENIIETDHAIVVYRNGERGILLTSVRKETNYPVLTIRDKHQSIIYHTIDGKYLGMEEEMPLDIVDLL